MKDSKFIPRSAAEGQISHSPHNLLSDLRQVDFMRKQLLRYFVIGCSGVILDLGTLYILVNFLHLPPVWGVIINQIIVLNYIFFLNRHWSFSAGGATAYRQMIKFFVVAGFNYLVAISWIWLFNHQLGINYLITRLGNIIVSTIWNFLLYKHWVYKVHAPVV